MKPSSGADPAAIRPLYEKHGVEEYYAGHGAEYRNPHEPVIHSLIEQAVKTSSFNPGTTTVLDLACGSGEVTLAFQSLGFTRIHGVDPYTGEAYRQRTGLIAEALSFQDVTDGALSSHHYDLAVCSFALHLPPLSLLPALCLQLTLPCRVLWVLTPHKRPHIKREWGWEMKEEVLVSRVRLRCYESVIES